LRFFFKFVISARDGHCDCSPRESKHLATPLQLSTVLELSER